MTTTEAIVVAAISSLLTGLGIREISPEAQQVVGELQEVTRVMDRIAAQREEITGRKEKPLPPLDIGGVMPQLKRGAEDIAKPETLGMPNL